jgi:CubicO group peptidase (beta-lactamase class C family)
VSPRDADRFRAAFGLSGLPGVVALAASPEGTFYSAALGVRHVALPAAMTPDTVFRIASMTKLVTTVAALQLVEHGRLALDVPVPDIDPTLSRPQVLEGFDAGGRPRLRPAAGPISLRQLLTHTAGFGYEMFDATLLRYVEVTGIPSFRTGRLAGLRLPLLFDPGGRWNYGISTDWVGRLIEAASGEGLGEYFQRHVCGPLGLEDTGFAVTASQRARQATLHRRLADGSLAPLPFEAPLEREFLGGGGGLYSTASDYLRLLRLLVNGGELDGVRLLRPKSVAELTRNQLGDRPAGVIRTAMPELANDLPATPGTSPRWGLACLINLRATATGRSAGSQSWSGLQNTYYWFDPARRLAAVFMTQVQPFADPAVRALYEAFEREVYRCAPQ